MEKCQAGGKRVIPDPLSSVLFAERMGFVDEEKNRNSSDVDEMVMMLGCGAGVRECAVGVAGCFRDSVY